MMLRNFWIKSGASVLLVFAALMAHQHERSPEEKEKIAKDMEKIAKALGVRCLYCHTDAERGLEDGDFTLLTEEGQYAHEEMFPLSKEFRVECSFCHEAAESLNAKGLRAEKDMKWMRRYTRKTGKKVTCRSCHIPGEPGREFLRLTAFAQRQKDWR
ncbi:MAG: hypothetical protein N2Z22_11920 [Turneriella sp.]|nr:hypothetical protein [Turneriella sp.]